MFTDMKGQMEERALEDCDRKQATLDRENATHE